MQHFSTPKIILCALLCGFLSISAHAASTYLPIKTSVLDSMVKASNYFSTRWSDASLQANFTSELSTHNNNSTSKARASNLWTRAVYLEGLMQLYKINNNAALKTRAVSWGTAYNWMPYGGTVTTANNADALCCGQVYIELSLLDNLPARRANIKSNIDLMVAAVKVSDLYWIDALQMAMPVFAKLGVTESNTAYFDKMYQLYQYPKTTLGLYNTTDHLWYRDAAYPDSLHNGLPIYWSRGNGWVVAALVRVLDVLPTSDTHRSEYVTDFKNMMAKLITIQRTDGFWNGSLVNPAFCGGPETSGTALFTYGLAWGIHNNLLDSATYYPPLAKAWEALQVAALQHINTAHTGITASRLLAGSLNWVQGSGSNPAHGNCIYDYDRPDFDDYGLGALLLAGSEVYKLAPTALLINVSSSTATVAGAANSTTNVNVTSNMTWNISSNQSWLTVTPSVATTGNVTLLLKATTQNTGSARTAVVTISGTGVTSKTITVTQNTDIGTALKTETNNAITIYPNPVTDRLQISGIKSVARLAVTDIYGKLVLDKEITDNEYVSMASLHSGMYIVKVSTSEGTFEKKVLKK